jgi:type IV pilus assembly protein PilY1
MNTLLKLLLLFSTFISLGSEAKSPPPGIGSDIPANILIMLDTSSSMNKGVAASPLRIPLDVAVDSKGNIFVSQWGDSLVKKFDSDGNFVKSWGGRNNGIFRALLRIAIDSDDNVYGSDTFQNKIHKFDNDGNLIKSWYSPFPDALEVDSSGNIYSSESSTYVRKINQSGEILARYNTRGYAGGGGYPFGISSYGGYVYVANAYNRSFTKYTEDLAPAAGTNKWSTSAQAWDIKASANGVYVANYGSNVIQKFSHTGTLQTTFGGTGHGNSDLYRPAGLSIHSNGNVYVADRWNHSIKIFDKDGIFVSHIGGKTRLDIAKESLKWIVSNPELNKGANFGLMTWDRTARMNTDIKPEGANEIFSKIDKVKAYCPWYGCTNIGNAMSLAQSYLSKPGVIKADCQKTALIVISDGGFSSGTTTKANNIAKSLYSGKKISTFVVSLASGVQQTHKDLAKNGGTYSDDGDDTNDYSPIVVAHKQKLIDALIEFVRLSIDDSKSTFTRPVLKQESESGDFVYQSTFKYVKNHQWQGNLKKYALYKGMPKDEPEWDAAKKLNRRSASNRNIWTIANITGIDTSLNNFVDTNSTELEFLLYKYSPEDPADSEVDNLINFIRGVDTYNEVDAVAEKKDNLLSGERWKLADIYHSELKVIDIPSALVSDADSNTEAYYRANNRYSDFVNGNRCGGACKDRKQVVYVGANDGLLHAFEYKHGKELWAFLPPNKLRDIRKVISNKGKQSHSIYGVDGTPVIKDIYFDKGNGKGRQWYTVLFSGLGFGGGGYFALDVTKPDSPEFLFAFRNDVENKIISHWDSAGDLSEYGYGGAGLPDDFKYNYSKLGDATSVPQIFLMPYKGKQKWVAVFGAGFNAGVNSSYGSAIYVIDLEDKGKVLKRIDIADSKDNDIANSVPAPVLIVTPDTTSLANYKGAMAYFADLEGGLWKLNLTDKGTLFDVTQIFNAESNFVNDRMEFFQVTSSIGTDDNLWLYYGTGNQQKLQRINNKIENRIYGIKDINFPRFKNISKPLTVIKMQDTTNAGAICPVSEDLGWYVNLDKNEKITGQLAIDNEVIYASRYVPNTEDLCGLGDAYLSDHGYMCGNALRKSKKKTYLGKGIATGAVVYKGKIYIGISGGGSGDIKDGNDKLGERKKNLIMLNPAKSNTKDKGSVSIESWREVF